jgi:hypothetical protein
MWSMTRKAATWPANFIRQAHQEVVGHYLCALTPDDPPLQASMGSVSTPIELYERNMIDELALRLVNGELPVGS